MAWRLHLSSRSVIALHLVPGSPDQVAVWNTEHDVYFYNQADGIHSGTRSYAGQTPPASPDDDSWREFVAGLRAPNGSCLPTVKISGLNIHTSRDGRLRLYHYQDGALTLEVEGQYVRLDRDSDGHILAADMDRALGLCGALTGDGQLLIFQQHVRIGHFPLDLLPDMTGHLTVLAPDASGTLLMSNSERVLITDSAGRTLHEMTPHFTSGVMAASPNGQVIALADIDNNVIRVYNRALVMTHQRHAIDVMAAARQVQLLASMPGERAAVSALSVADDGTLAFAMGGVICVSHLEDLDELPQPRRLFEESV